MNRNYNLTLTCKATCKGEVADFDFDPYNDCTDIDGLKELAISEFDADEINEGEEITKKMRFLLEKQFHSSKL